MNKRKIIQDIVIEKLISSERYDKFIDVMKTIGFRFLYIGSRKQRCYLYKKLPNELHLDKWLTNNAASFLIEDVSVFDIDELKENVFYKL